MKNIAPALNFAPELLLQAQGVKVVFFDVDGVLTDGGIAIDDAGHETKRFHVRDGAALRMWARLGYETAVIPGRNGMALRQPLRELGVRPVVSGSKEKGPAGEGPARGVGSAAGAGEEHAVEERRESGPDGRARGHDGKGRHIVAGGVPGGRGAPSPVVGQAHARSGAHTPCVWVGSGGGGGGRGGGGGG